MTIKETAGKVLLYFYQLQRAAPLTMAHRQVGFLDKKDKGLALTSDKRWLTKDLIDINPAATDIFNALNFLIDKGFINSRERVTAEARIYVGVQLTAAGIDIVEGVERGKDGKKDFDTTFNIKIEGSTDVDSLVKQNLGDLLD